MTYIIPPSWFYFLQLVSSIRSLIATIFGIMCGVTLVLFAYFIASFLGWGMYDETDMPKFRKAFKKAFIATVLLAIVGTVIPSKETLVEMQIARYATVENAEWTLEAIKSAVDYVVEAIKSLK